MTPPAPSRALCLWLMGASAVVFVVLAAVFVPWSWVPGGHVVHVRGSEVFSAEQLRRGQTYASMQRHLGWASLAVSLAVALVLGLTRLGARLVRLLPGPWWVKALAGTLLILLVGQLATLPFDLAIRGNALVYGLTRQSLGGWLRDSAVSLLVSWVFAGGTVLVVMVSARRSPRRWPLWAGLAGAVLSVLGSWVYPVVVEPLFNHFTPLPHGELRTRILALAEKEHVHVSDVLVADASRRTTTLNAYVSGFGSTRRVVLYDNLVDDVPQRETLVVVAHELGHAHHDDVLLGTALGATGVVFASGLLGLLFTRRRLLDRAGVPDPGQPEVVALLLALVAVGTLLASPIQNVISRAIEARADRASLQATGDYSGFEKMQVQLATRSLSDPDPPWLSQLWFGSHPTALQRIGMARAIEQEHAPR
ncbi:M48 family metallopeptidase [Marmoricola sp. URHB0036]|uniref:M48 family metallopeptidase n=1 Tax=Marmoricola sp. URHB0036 TaxID=1298863 RepID=UPI001E64AB0C|nr:M48 family metallopeptidase [Marmoricola sp. URHB0036]